MRYAVGVISQKGDEVMKKSTDSKNKLVFVKREDVFTDSKIIAIGTKTSHETIQKRIKKYKSEFEQLGNFRISNPKKNSDETRGRKENIYLLNEPQATFLITLLKNTDTVIKFKLELVKEFYRMRKIVIEKQSLEWQQARQQGKLIRREETDGIKMFVEYAKKQGSKNADMYYMHFSKLANKLAGINGKMRDVINGRQLMYLSIAENTILKAVTEGMEKSLNYHSIYEICKSRLDILISLSIIPKTNQQMQISDKTNTGGILNAFI